jgi:hypothetical protein
MIRIYLFLLIFTLFCACSENLGNRIEATNLTVFFEDKSDFETAKKIAYFWKENELIGSKHQHLKLRKSKNTYFIHLIANDKNKIKQIKIDEIKLLLDLQNEIDSILPKKFKTNILICNSSFEPIFNINN